jgi:hypothetical protein
MLTGLTHGRYMIRKETQLSSHQYRIGLDVMSNGFKIKATGAAYNTNNATLVGLAFADQPGKYSHAR